MHIKPKQILIEEKDVDRVEYPHLFYLDTKFLICAFMPNEKTYVCEEVKEK